MKAVIPLKDFDSAKQRLASILTLPQRRQFVTAMIEDVLDVVSCHSAIDQVILVSDEAHVVSIAHKYNAETIDEKSLDTVGLNASLQAAVHQLGQRVTNDDILLLHGDLPLLTSKDMDELLSTYAQCTEPTLLIAPDRHGTGTNCLAFPIQCTPKFCFGADSYRQHVNQAQAMSLSCVTIKNQGFSCDIDLPEDIDILLADQRAVRSKKCVRYIQGSGLSNSPAHHPNGLVSATIA